MAQKDQLKWDKKYTNTPTLLEHREPSSKLVKILNKVDGKEVLDVACGAGKHSVYLAKEGFKVTAIDISTVALKSLEKRGYQNITTAHVDLDDYQPKPNSYDLIVKTNFLDRALIPKLSGSLKPNGIFFIETYMEDSSNEKPPSNPDFLLKKEELKQFFDEKFEVIMYEEFDNEPYEIFKMKKQAIAIKRLT